MAQLRLAKRISESGIASRREAERLIESGKVAVDGEIITTLVFFVTDKNKIVVDGKSISKKSEEIIIWKFNKPRGVLTTKHDPQNRKTVFDFFKDEDHRLLYIGRLDYNSEGLLLFTNNGDVARKLELPSTGLTRSYKVRIFGNLTESKIQILKKGIIIGGIKYGSVNIEMDKSSINKNSANFWATVTLSEGKNREIRKIMEYCGCTVNRLIRVSYGPFKLENLPIGHISKIPKQDVTKLLDLLSIKN